MQGTDCFCNWKAPRWCSLPLIKFLLLIILMMVNHSKETGCLQIHYAGNSGGGAVGESPDNEAAQRASPSPLPMQALLLTLWHILTERKKCWDAIASKKNLGIKLMARSGNKAASARLPMCGVDTLHECHYGDLEDTMDRTDSLGSLRFFPGHNCLCNCKICLIERRGPLSNWI